MINSIKTENEVNIIKVTISNIENRKLDEAEIDLKTNGNDVEINKFTSGILKETIYAIISSLETPEEIRKIEIMVED